MGAKTLQKDDNNDIIPTGKGFLTADASNTPKKSPLSVLSSAEQTIVFPEDAVELVFVSISADLRISELLGGTANGQQYFVLPASTGEVVQMANGGSVYVKGDTGTSVIQFYFRTI